jgi:hypothetical protein
MIPYSSASAKLTRSMPAAPPLRRTSSHSLSSTPCGIPCRTAHEPSIRVGLDRPVERMRQSSGPCPIDSRQAGPQRAGHPEPGGCRCVRTAITSASATAASSARRGSMTSAAGSCSTGRTGCTGRARTGTPSVPWNCSRPSRVGSPGRAMSPPAATLVTATRTGGSATSAVPPPRRREPGPLLFRPRCARKPGGAWCPGCGSGHARSPKADQESGGALASRRARGGGMLR